MRFEKVLREELVSENNEEKDITSKVHIANALMKTLENILPHAAHNVEKESLKLSEAIRELLKHLASQQKYVQQIVSLLNKVEMNGKEASLDEFLAFLRCTLAFSLEKNLVFSESSGEWVKTIEENVAELNEIKQSLAGADGAQKALGKKLDGVVSNLLRMQSRMEDITTNQREKTFHQNDLKVLNDLIEKQPDKSVKLEELLKQIDESITDSKNLASSCIIAMQFQDRNSQIMENASRLLKQYREMIDYGKNDQDYLGNATNQLLQNFYSNIQMSDIRSIFIKALEGEHIALPTADKSQNDNNDDIELF